MEKIIKKIAAETPNSIQTVASSFVNAKKYDLPFRLGDLQYFAEPTEPTDPTDPTDPVDPVDPEPTEPPAEPEEKTFTQEELEDIVKQRLARAEKDKQKAIAEAEKLAKMSADQKREYEFEKLKKENEELKAAQTRNELGKEATKILAESGIIANEVILSYVVKDDAEKTSQSVTAFTDMVTALVDVLVKEKLRGDAPRRKGTPSGLTKESILQETDTAKRQKLIQENNHLFR